MSAVPQSLREGAFGMGANRMQVSLRVVFPAALSGIVAALVLGASRAVGETVIILLAGRPARPNLGAQPARVGYADDGRVHRRAPRAATSRPGSIEYKTIFAVGLTLFVCHAVLNARLDPPRPQVPAGLRMTGAQIAARAATQRRDPGRARGGDRAFARLASAS